MGKILPFLIALPLATVSQDKTNHFSDSAQLFFESVVVDGMVDYTGIKSHPQLLNQLVSQIGEFELNQVDAPTRKAFMINAYNILVIKGVVDNYPVSSPMKINGFFDKQSYLIDGKHVSLNQLEKKMLFIEFPDNRLHFVLVCAALSCPKLSPNAYLPANLDDQLTDQTRTVMNDKNFIQESNGKLKVSEIFQWYASDFKGQSILEYVNRYRDTPFEQGIKIGYYTYDWTLNDQKEI